MSIYTLVIIILVRKCVLPANRYRRGAAWDTPATDTRGRREVAERTRPRMAARCMRAPSQVEACDSHRVHHGRSEHVHLLVPDPRTCPGPLHVVWLGLVHLLTVPSHRPPARASGPVLPSLTMPFRACRSWERFHRACRHSRFRMSARATSMRSSRAAFCAWPLATWSLTRSR